MWGNLHMSHINGIISFQTKKSNLERDLHKETDIKWVTKGNRKIPHTLFESISYADFLLVMAPDFVMCDMNWNLMVPMPAKEFYRTHGGNYLVLD